MQVTLTRIGNLVIVEPPCSDLLERHLVFQKRIQQGGSARDVAWQTVCLYRIEGNRLFAPAGLTRRLYDVLKEAGHDIKFVDQRERNLPDPDLTLLDPLREGQDEVIAAIVAFDRGIIEAPTAFGKSFLLRQICKIWPTANVIICSPFRGILVDTMAALRELFPPSQIGLCGLGHQEADRRITVTTDRSLRACDLARCQVFIFDEVHRAAAPCTAEAIAQIANARMYGFSASPYGRSDQADLETEAMFGPSICKMGYADAEKSGSVVPVRVFLLDCSPVADPGVTSDNTTVLERWALWRNKDRNNLIMRAVKHAYAAYGPDTQILIATAKVEHSVHLFKAAVDAGYPDFQLVYGSMDLEKRDAWVHQKLIPEGVHPLASHMRDQLQFMFRDRKILRAIATGVWGTGVNFPGLNVLIRADGQSGDIASTQIPGRVTRTAEGKDVGIVVDLDDRFNRSLLRRAQQRVRVYRKKGWEIVPLTL